MTEPLHDRYAALRSALIALVTEIGHPHLQYWTYSGGQALEVNYSAPDDPSSRFIAEVRRPYRVHDGERPATIYLSGFPDAVVAPVLALIAEHVGRQKRES